MGDQQYPPEEVAKVTFPIMSRIVGGTHPLVVQSIPQNHRESVRTCQLHRVCDPLCADRNQFISSGYFGILASMFIPPGYPVQIYIVVCRISQGPATSFNKSSWDIARLPIVIRATDWLGHRICRNEGRCFCTLSTCRRGNVAKCRQ